MMVSEKCIKFLLFSSQNFLHTLFLCPHTCVHWSLDSYFRTEQKNILPENLYLFKFINRNTKNGFRIYLTLTIKTQEGRHWRRSKENIYLFKFINRNTKKGFQIYLMLTIKTQEGRHWRRSKVFIVKFEQISHIFLMFLLLTLNR